MLNARPAAAIRGFRYNVLVMILVPSVVGGAFAQAIVFDRFRQPQKPACNLTLLKTTAMDGGSAANAGAICGRPPGTAECRKRRSSLRPRAARSAGVQLG